MTAEFATKSDIALVRGDVAAAHVEMNADIAGRRSDMKSLENRSLIKRCASMLSVVGAITALPALSRRTNPLP